jgi:hydroxymethylbilane synthase
MPLRLGTRGSELALWQARRVAAMVRGTLGRECEIVIVKTRGDQVHNVAFHKMEGKGFFTKELQEALLASQVDLVVHSLKDLPTDEPDGLTVLAIPERATPTDVLLSRRGLRRPTPDDPLGLPARAVVGTSSLRRAAQVLARSPEVTIDALRGNVPTRIAKLRAGRYDAILLAAAGIHRLEIDLDGLDLLDLPPEVMLPAPGQGALAIEGRAGDPDSATLAALHDEGLARCVGAERRLLELLGGGCHLPLGCLAEETGDGLRLQAVLGEVDEAISQATVSRVAALSPDPEVAVRTCHEALRLACPTQCPPVSGQVAADQGGNTVPPSNDVPER